MKSDAKKDGYAPKFAKLGTELKIYIYIDKSLFT